MEASDNGKGRPGDSRVPRSAVTPTKSLADPDGYLRTDFLLGDLAGRSVRAGFLKIGAQVGQLALLGASGVLLARLLTPEDFGLYAMVLSLTAFVDNFRDFGLPMAAVQRQDLDHRQFSGLFWVTQRLNLLTVGFVALMAPLVARFYAEPRLIPVTLTIAAGIFLLGLTLQHESLLVRRMRFGVITGIEAGSVLVGVLAGIGLALRGAGYWALVLQFVASALTRSVALWLAAGWRPEGARRALRTLSPEVRSFLRFGGHYTGYRVLTHIGFRLDRVLVGLLAGAPVMGLYDNSFRWSRYPIRAVYPPLLSVAVASLSRLQGEPEAYRQACRKAILPVLALVVPAFGFGIAEGRSLILVLLGRQWLDAVPFFRLFCLAGIASSLTLITKWLYLSSGETRRQFHWALIYAPLMIAAVAVGASRGPLGVAVAFTAASWLLTPPALAFCFATSHLTMRAFAGTAWRPLVASAVATFATLAMRPVLPAGIVLELFLALMAFALMYGITWMALPGGRAAGRDLVALRRALRFGRVEP